MKSDTITIANRPEGFELHIGRKRIARRKNYYAIERMAMRLSQWRAKQPLRDWGMA